MELKKIGAKDDRILLQSEDGKKGLFTFLDMLSYNGREYAALADDADELIIMEFLEQQGDNAERYREIEDDALFDAVLSLFAAQNPEEFED